MQSISKRLGVRVLHEGPGELVLNKPAGIASELSDDRKGSSLLERVRRELHLDEARLPHRLDRVTCGLLLVAKDGAAAAWHGDRIREGGWQKLYLARVRTRDLREGLVGEHRAYLKRRKGTATLVRSGGKPSALRILASETAPAHVGESHVLVHLLTGRFHQVRVMLAGLGAPLVGDGAYGGSEGQLFLQHARLSFRPFGEAEALTLEAPEQEGEEVSPALLERLRNYEAC